MPVRDGMPWLPWALEDLAKSRVQLEILVCDDGSRDASMAFLTKVQEHIEELRKQTEENSETQAKKTEKEQLGERPRCQETLRELEVEESLQVVPDENGKDNEARHAVDADAADAADAAGGDGGPQRSWVCQELFSHCSANWLGID